MRGAVPEQNYWPGYLDALINVMLNLLFLVAVFAIGLLLLNVQTMSQQRQLTDLNVQQPQTDQAEPGQPFVQAGPGQRLVQAGPGQQFSLGAQSQQVIDAMGLSEAEKERIVAKLQKMDVASMVDRRRQLDAKSQEVALQEMLMASKKAELSGTLEEQKKRLLEKNQRLAQYEQGLKEVANKLALEKEQLANLQRRKSERAQDWVIDIRIAPRTPGSQAMDPQSLIRQALGVVPQAVWEYAEQEKSWNKDRSPPSGYATAAKGQGWKLVVFADIHSPQVLRDAFTRGNAVRERMVQDGHLRTQIQVEMKSSKEIAGMDEAVYRQVFMLPRQ